MLHIFANLSTHCIAEQFTKNNNCSITLNLGLEKIKIQLIYEYFSNYFFMGCTTLLLYSFLNKSILKQMQSH